MNVLTSLGLSCMATVAAFTWWCYRDDKAFGGGQTRREAIIEVWIGIVVGFSLNWSINFLVLPLVHARFTALENFWLGWIYTLASVLRGYTIRRWADRHIRTFSRWLARRLGMT
jgi:hypothetical protein